MDEPIAAQRNGPTVRSDHQPPPVIRIDRTLALLGSAGLFLAALVLGVIAVRGDSFISPEGHLTKSLTFDAALGVYYLTLAFYLPQATFSRRKRRVWLGAVVLITVYGLGVETVQIFRGLDPRFSNEGATADDIAAGLFALSALGQIVAFSVLSWNIIRRPASLLVLAIRYAGAATMVAFAVGLWMSAMGGREVGDEGNLLALHALGFHALQAIPLVAWLLERSQVSAGRARPTVHLAGLAWLTMCLALAWQTATGRAPLDASPAVLIAGALLLLWTAAFIWVLLNWLKGGKAMRPRYS